MNVVAAHIICTGSLQLEDAFTDGISRTSPEDVQHVFLLLSSGCKTLVSLP